MKSKYVRKLFKNHITEKLPGYSIKGHLIYKKNNKYLLQGFYFESSAFNRNSFTVEVFVQPIYIPSKEITFTLGNRLGVIAKRTDIWWEYEKSQEKDISQEILDMIVNAGLPFLENRNSINKLLKEYKHTKVDENKYKVEAIAYAYILVDEYKKSENMLNSFNVILSQEIKNNPKITWLNDIQNRVQMILGFLKNQEYDCVKDKLDEWGKFTLSNLGLMKINVKNQLPK